MAKVKFTILATGEIAEKMAKTLNKMTNKVELYGVISRDLKRAQKFAKKHNFKKAFDSLEAVISDSKTQVVYIGSPHHMHFEHAQTFLQNNIAVLCEKPICVNSKQTLELLQLSSAHQTLLVDATWSRYMPYVKQVKELAKKYNLGELKNIHASLGIQKQNVDRMILPEMAGGSLLDVGIYPVTFACAFNQGDVTSIQSSAVMTEKEVDQSVSMILKFADGMMASLQSSMGSILSDVSTLSYEFGKIECKGIPNVKTIKVYNESKLLETIKVDKQITGYEYEVLETINALKNKSIEPKSLPHTETLKVMAILDEVRSQIGLVYPFEK